MSKTVDFAIEHYTKITIGLLGFLAVIVLVLGFGAAYAVAKYQDVRPHPYKVRFVTLNDDGAEGSQTIDLSPQFVVTGLEGEKWIIDPRDGHARLHDPEVAQ